MDSKKTHFLVFQKQEFKMLVINDIQNLVNS
ncbi:MAG: hypothetical protein ACI9XO_001474 [Paraglaciecola sp.]|jgi:hypothetical protein